jgi:transglutaminase-like putative cysteine protease
MQYGAQTADLRAASLMRSEEVVGTDDVASFAKRLYEESGGQLPTFLNLLNQAIYTDFEFLHRGEGDPWAPSDTLDQMRGACRDYAVLFIEACRSLGIAARFVSGYQEGDDDQDRRDLHAWAEVYISGGGWRGYDPTHGLVVADRHVAVAGSAFPRCAAPFVGSFRGTGATATMEAEIELRCEEISPVEQQAQRQQQQ